LCVADAKKNDYPVADCPLGLKNLSNICAHLAQIHLKGKDVYKIDDDIFVYFCFPTLGVAVPLQPGDFLLFNALIPHCVSSRCRQDNDIFNIAMYLKTSVVGMNNNQLPVRSNQTFLAEWYCNAIDK